MTLDEQRIAIAEWMGWTNIVHDNEELFGLVPDCEMMDSQGADVIRVLLPNYPLDLNAMHEVEQELARNQ